LSAEDISVMPIDIGLAVEMKIVNPVKAIFKIQNWYGSSANLIQGGVRDQIRKRNYLGWINFSEKVALGDYFEKEMELMIDKIRDDFGVKVVKIKVVQIEPSDKRYKEASTRKAVADFEKQAIEVEAQAQRIKRTIGTIGPIIDSIVEITGQSREEVQSEWKNDPESFEKKYERSINRSHDIVKAQTAGDKYVKIETSDTKGRQGGSALAEIVILSKALDGAFSASSTNKSASQKESKESKESPEEKMRRLGYKI